MKRLLLNVILTHVFCIISYSSYSQRYEWDYYEIGFEVAGDFNVSEIMATSFLQSAVMPKYLSILSHGSMKILMKIISRMSFQIQPTIWSTMKEMKLSRMIISRLMTLMGTIYFQYPAIILSIMSLQPYLWTQKVLPIYLYQLALMKVIQKRQKIYYIAFMLMIRSEAPRDKL